MYCGVCWLAHYLRINPISIGNQALTWYDVPFRLDLLRSSVGDSKPNEPRKESRSCPGQRILISFEFSRFLGRYAFKVF